MSGCGAQKTTFFVSGAIAGEFRQETRTLVFRKLTVRISEIDPTYQGQHPHGPGTTLHRLLARSGLRIRLPRSLGSPDGGGGSGDEVEVGHRREPSVVRRAQRSGSTSSIMFITASVVPSSCGGTGSPHAVSMNEGSATAGPLVRPGGSCGRAASCRDGWARGACGMRIQWSSAMSQRPAGHTVRDWRQARFPISR